MNLFTYGSLMYRQVWQRVVRGNYRAYQALLINYCRRQIKGDHYPVIFPGSENDQITGMLYLGLDQQDLTRLDHFEGSYYKRVDAAVHTGGQLFNCQTYVLKPDYYHLISETEWSEKKFEQSGLKAFSEKYIGFDHIK